MVVLAEKVIFKQLNSYLQTFLRHLKTILLHDFPEHYGEVLNLALKLSEAQTLSLDVWWTILDALTTPEQQKLRLGNGFKDQLRIYATQQRLLGLTEVHNLDLFCTSIIKNIIETSFKY